MSTGENQEQAANTGGSASEEHPHLDQIRDIVGRLHRHLENAQPGTVSWTLAYGRLMGELIRIRENPRDEHAVRLRNHTGLDMLLAEFVNERRGTGEHTTVATLIEFSLLKIQQMMEVRGGEPDRDPATGIPGP